MLNRIEYNYPGVVDEYIRRSQILSEVKTNEELIHAVIDRLPGDNIFRAQSVLIHVFHELERNISIIGSKANGDLRFENNLHNNIMAELLPLLDVRPDRQRQFPHYLKVWLKNKATFDSEIWQKIYNYLFVDEL